MSITFKGMVVTAIHHQSIKHDSVTFTCSQCQGGAFRVTDPRMCPHVVIDSEPTACPCGSEVIVSLMHWQNNDPDKVLRHVFCKDCGEVIERCVTAGICASGYTIDKEDSQDMAAKYTSYDDLPDTVKIEGKYTSLGKVIKEGTNYVVTSYAESGVFIKSGDPGFTLFKVLGERGQPVNGGDSTLVWSLPVLNEDKTWTPGDWMEIPADKPVELCRTGFHVCDSSNVHRWAYNCTKPRVFVAEVDAPLLGGADKYVTRRVRLLREVPYAGFSTGANVKLPTVSTVDVIKAVPELAAEFDPWGAITVPEGEAYDAARQAFEARDVEAYEAAVKAFDRDTEIADLEARIAKLRGEDDTALRARSYLAISHLVTEPSLSGLISLAAKRMSNGIAPIEYTAKDLLNSMYSATKLRLQIEAFLQEAAQPEDWRTGIVFH